jgi:transposase
VEHGLAPLRALARPGAVRGGARRPGRERRGRGAGADDRRHRGPRPPARGWRQRGQDGQALGRSRGGFSTKLHLRCDGNGLPLAIVLTPGQTHEARIFDVLVEDMAPGTRCLIGDMGYDADRIRQELLSRGILPVIPSNPVRKEPLLLDRELYRLRNRVERLNNRLKQFRAVATRYDKTAASYLAFVQLAASRLWLRFVHTA